MKFRKIVTIGIVDSTIDSSNLKKIDYLTDKRVSLQKDNAEIKSQLKDADCLLVNIFQYPVPKEIIDSAPNLKYIGVFSTAYGKVDIKAATEKGISVCNIPGFSTEAVAEFAFAAVLENIRHVESCKQLARERDFSEVPKIPHTEIKGKKFGIIGPGRIGMRIAELARAFGADVSYWSRERKDEADERGINFKDLDKLIFESDFLSINLSYNKETENFMNAERIAKIKSGAIFINLSPNELIDFQALEKRLSKGEIVYIADHTDEMPEDLVGRLLSYKTCILYPPLAFATDEARIAKQRIFVSNIESFLKGKPINVVS